MKKYQYYDTEAGVFRADDGPADCPPNVQTGSTYTLQAGDTRKTVAMENAGGNEVLIPAHATVPLPVGTRIPVVQLGAGTTKIKAAPGVTVSAAGGRTVLLEQYSRALLWQVAEDEWILSGDLRVPVFHPGDYGPVILWLNSDGLAGADGDPLSAWTRSAGTGPDLAYPGGGIQPELMADARNGLPAMAPQGDGSQISGLATEGVSFAHGIGSTDDFYLAVAILPLPGSQVFLSDGDGSLYCSLNPSAGTITVALGATLTPSASSVVFPEGWSVLEVYRVAGVVKLCLNGVELSSSAIEGAPSTLPWVFGIGTWGELSPAIGEVLLMGAMPSDLAAIRAHLLGAWVD